MAIQEVLRGFDPDVCPSVTLSLNFLFQPNVVCCLCFGLSLLAPRFPSSPLAFDPSLILRLTNGDPPSATIHPLPSSNNNLSLFVAIFISSLQPRKIYWPCSLLTTPDLPPFVLCFRHFLVLNVCHNTRAYTQKCPNTAHKHSSQATSDRSWHRNVLRRHMRRDCHIRPPNPIRGPTNPAPPPRTHGRNRPQTCPPRPHA